MVGACFSLVMSNSTPSAVCFRVVPGRAVKSLDSPVVKSMDLVVPRARSSGQAGGGDVSHLGTRQLGVVGDVDVLFSRGWHTVEVWAATSWATARRAAAEKKLERMLTLVWIY
jgi:hypothetical protein